MKTKPTVLIVLFLLSIFSCQWNRPDEVEKRLDFSPGWSMLSYQLKNDFALADTNYPKIGPCYIDPETDVVYSSTRDTLFSYPENRRNGYFTIPSSVTVIDVGAFQDNLNLKEIIIPEGVEEIEAKAFFHCNKLRIVNIRGRIDTIRWRTFEGCEEMVSLEIPFSVRTIEENAFADCVKLKRIVVRNPEPPKLMNLIDVEKLWSFVGVDTNRCVLQVPFGSVKKYREAPGWDKFKRIEGNIKPIPHRWVDLDSTLCAQNGIRPDEIAVWKWYFDKKFIFDEWYASHIKYFVNEDRYLAITDLQNLGFDEKNDTIARIPCTLWRMMQYCGRNHIRIPSSKSGLARCMQMQVDSILRYTPLSNADIGDKAALEEYLRGWFYDFLSYQTQMKVELELRALLEQEDTAWKQYHEKAMKAFDTIADDSGSGYAQFYYQFGGIDQTMRRIGTESFFRAIFPDAKLQHFQAAGKQSMVSDEEVLRAYQLFHYPSYADMYGDWPSRKSLRKMKAALEDDLQSWEDWMEVRKTVSEVLSGEEKEVWDNATNAIRGHKLIMLKKSYDIWDF